MAPDVAQRVIEAAHQVCPYSRATHGNISVETKLVQVAAEERCRETSESVHYAAGDLSGHSAVVDTIRGDVAEPCGHVKRVLLSLPSDAYTSSEWDAFLAALARPVAQSRIKALMERGFHEPVDV